MRGFVNEDEVRSLPRPHTLSAHLCCSTPAWPSPIKATESQTLPLPAHPSHPTGLVSPMCPLLLRAPEVYADINLLTILKALRVSDVWPLA